MCSTIHSHPNSRSPPKLYSINSTFGVGYGTGGVQGIAYRDTVVIGEAIGRTQFIGAANQTDGFNLVKPIDGIRTFLSISLNKNTKYELRFLRSRFGTIWQ